MSRFKVHCNKALHAETASFWLEASHSMAIALVVDSSYGPGPQLRRLSKARSGAASTGLQDSEVYAVGLPAVRGAGPCVRMMSCSTTQRYPYLRSQSARGIGVLVLQLIHHSVLHRTSSAVVPRWQHACTSEPSESLSFRGFQLQLRHPNAHAWASARKPAWHAVRHWWTRRSICHSRQHHRHGCKQSYSGTQDRGLRPNRA